MSADRPRANANGDAFPAQVTAAVGRWAPALLRPRLSCEFANPADTVALGHKVIELQALPPGEWRWAPTPTDEFVAGGRIMQGSKIRHTCADEKGKEGKMAKFKVRATATVDLEFRVEAEDEDTANDLASEMAKQIRADARGSVDIPRDAAMSWPAADQLEWYETVEEG